MDELDLLDRYLIFIYNHPCFGLSTERSDLIKGIGMTLKCFSTDDITDIVLCMSRASNPHSLRKHCRKRCIMFRCLKMFFRQV
jgi:hypothetical protein